MSVHYLKVYDEMSAQTFNNHFFYSAINLPRDKDENTFYHEYIQKNFDHFWEDFFSYLSIFHTQVKQTFLSKSPKTYLITVLRNVLNVLSRTIEINYTESMKKPLNNCLKTLFHPDNNVEIKNYGFEIFKALGKAMVNKFDKYTNEIYEYVLDYSEFDSKLKIKGLEYKIILTESDQKKSNDSVIKTIKDLLNYILKEDLESTFWNFIITSIICPVYKSITNELNHEKLDRVIDGKYPEELHNIIISFLEELPSKRNKTFLIQIFQIYSDSPEYIFSLIELCSKEEFIRQIDPKNIVNNLVHVYIMWVAENDNVIDFLYKNGHHPCLIKLMNTLINFFSFSFSFNDYRELINTLSETFDKFLVSLFDVFDDKDKNFIIFMILHPNASSIPPTQCRLHLLSMIFYMFIKKPILEKELWQTLFNEIIQEPTQIQKLLFSCCANFVGYYSIYISSIFLNINSEKMSQYGEILNKWMNNEKYWIKMDVLKTPYELYKEKKNLFVSPEILTDDIKQINIPKLDYAAVDINKIKDNKDVVNSIISIKNLIFEVFRWKDLESTIQFYVYLVGASFISPLLYLISVLFPEEQINYKIMLEQFIDFLFNSFENFDDSTDPSISTHALNMIGQLICHHNCRSLLTNEVLANWYLILNYCLVKEYTLNTKMKALKYACKTLFLGFKGSSILLNSIISNLESADIHCQSSNSSNDENEVLSTSEIASLLLSLLSICDISNENNISIYFQENIMKYEVKEQIINVIKRITPDLSIPFLIASLIEVSTSLKIEVSSNMKESKNNFTKLLLRTLFASISIKNNDKNAISIDTLYSIMPLTLILEELEQVSSGSIARILDETLNILNNHFEPNQYDTTFSSFIDFFVDVFIQSSSLISKLGIDITEQFESFQKFVMKNSKEVDKRVLYSLMFLSVHFLRHPNPSPDFAIPNSDIKEAIFGFYDDCILKVSNNAIYSLIPVGQFYWNFKFIDVEPSISELSEDVKIASNFPSPIENEEQKQFSNVFQAFEDNLFTNTLQSTFNIQNPRQYKPSDFISSNSTSLPPTLDYKEPHTQNLPPKTVGPSSSAFMNSLNFYDLLLTNRLFSSPGSDPQKIENVIRSLTDNPNYVLNKFKHVLSCVILSSSNIQSKHFDDFKIGLGLINKSSKEIIYEDCRHKIIFSSNFLGEINFETDQYKNKSVVPNVFILWNESINQDDLINFYRKSIPNIKILITPQANGLYAVNVSIYGGICNSKSLSEILISKHALPVFIISQIISNVHKVNNIIGSVVNPITDASSKICSLREDDEAFINYPLLLCCTKELLRVS